jgi:drug/metabolite transporter (DMT)-like permease
MSSRALPYLALALAVVSLGFSAIFVRWAGAPGTVSAFYRVGLAAVVMAVPALRRVKRESPLPRRGLWLAMLAGLFFAGDLGTWSTAVMVGNAANVTLLANTAPIWAGLGALLLFGERRGWVFWGGLLLATLGAVLVAGSDFLAHPRLGYGDLLGLVAGVFYGAYFLATQRAREGVSSVAAWWVSTAVSAGVLLAASWGLGFALVGYSPATYFNLLAVALLTQVGGYIAISYALGRLPASVVAPTLLGQPVLTALLSGPLLGEGLEMVQVVGGLVVLAGIWLVHWRGRVSPASPRQTANTKRTVGRGES